MNVDRAARIGVIDRTNRVLPRKGNIGKTILIERPRVRLVSLLRPYDEPLVENCLSGIAMIAHFMRNLISPALFNRTSRPATRPEDIPIPEFAVATQVDFSRANATNGHADVGEVLTIALGVKRRFTSIGQ